jgi:hypothetical protein
LTNMHENPIKERLAERWIVGFAAAAVAGAFLNFEKVAATTPVGTPDLLFERG